MTKELPPLPEPDRVHNVQFADDIELFTADQMRAYARASLAAQPVAQAPESLAHRTVDDCMRIIRAHDPSDLTGMEAAFRANIAAAPSPEASNPVQAEAPSDTPLEFFAFSDDLGFKTFKTEAEARECAEGEIAEYRREAAAGDEWPSGVESVRYGVVMGSATEQVFPADEPGEEDSADYQLTATPPTASPVQAEAPIGYLPIPEDETERRYFDLATETYGGDVRANINLTLRQFAAQRPGGSFAATLHIIANEVLKLHTMPATPPTPCGEVERNEPPHIKVIQLAERYGLDASMVGGLRNFADAYARSALATQPLEQKPVAWANADELDNMLDDRTATVAGTESGLRRVALYLGPQPEQVAQDSAADPTLGSCAECGVKSTKNSMWALYCLPCVQTKIAPALQSEQAAEQKGGA